MKQEKRVIKDTDVRGNKNKGIVSFMKNMDDVVMNSNWHIL